MASDCIPRLVDADLDRLMVEAPAVALEGPKGVGKTATASRRSRTVIDLSVDEQAESVRNEPSRLSSDPAPILPDEWQRLL
ncbi:MAG: hypothetical protein LBO20_01220 [Bifidobacteriaceae bacterium]|jgi:hypothetical protein|nr:hypothetical protein [Bifidobacteriaceae bacterium]